MRILGIDPGESTGVCILNDGILEYYSVFDGDDVWEIKEFIETSNLDYLIVESQFRYIEKLCRRRFTWEIYAIELGIPYMNVLPNVWYSHFGLKRGDKAATIKHVEDTYGIQLVGIFGKSAGSDVADSIMIAKYAENKIKGVTKNARVFKKSKVQSNDNMVSNSACSCSDRKNVVQKRCSKSNRTINRRGGRK